MALLIGLGGELTERGSLWIVWASDCVPASRIGLILFLRAGALPAGNLVLLLVVFSLKTAIA